MSRKDPQGFPPDSWVGMNQWLNGEDLTDDYVREVMVEVAKSCVGLKPSDPSYQQALYPWDPQAARESLVREQHKCALTVLVLLRALGYELPEDGKALAWKYGFWKPPAGVRPPEDPMTQLQQLPGWRAGMALPPAGDAMIIGRISEPTSTHALTVVGYEDSGHTVVSVDGGMGAVRLARRAVVQLGHQVCLHDPQMKNRPILGSLDVASMRHLVVREYSMPR